jgi:hypothetical protein
MQDEHLCLPLLLSLHLLSSLGLLVQVACNPTHVRATLAPRGPPPVDLGMKSAIFQLLVLLALPDLLLSTRLALLILVDPAPASTFS